jgi:UDP-galactopyranose mutase
MSFDAIVVGAGFAGAVVARALAVRGRLKVAILERRPHIGGNCFDRYNEAGILIHQYGPHIFHTESQRVFEYLSQFTSWIAYEHCVLANVWGKGFPIPFNLSSLYAKFDREKAKRLEEKLISAFGKGKSVPILTLRNSADEEIRELAEYVYQNIFLVYTMKRSGKTPEEIDPAVAARVPVVISRDNRYFHDKYQGMPDGGYTELFKRLLKVEGAGVSPIEVRLGVDAREWLSVQSRPGRDQERQILYKGQPFGGLVVFTGQVDEFFNGTCGALPYRTIDFEFQTLDMDSYQPGAVVHYTVDQSFTRITEFRRRTGQKIEGKTTIVREFSKAYVGGDQAPYYAISNPKGQEMYAEYQRIANSIPGFYLLGRLAEFKYYNMDAVVERALELADMLVIMAETSGNATIAVQ